MPGVTHVVTNVKLVVMHSSPFHTPLKETAAGEGGNSFRSAHDFRPSRVSNNLNPKTNQAATTLIAKFLLEAQFSIETQPLG